MKTCSLCQISQDESEFHFRSVALNTRFSHCRTCQKVKRKASYAKNRQQYIDYSATFQKEQYKKVRQFIIDYKSGKPCADCKQIYPHYVMDFDHLPGSKKTISIGQFGARYSIENLQKEFLKCELVCSNCHRERTWARRTKLQCQTAGNAG